MQKLMLLTFKSMLCVYLNHCGAIEIVEGEKPEEKLKKYEIN